MKEYKLIAHAVGNPARGQDPDRCLPGVPYLQTSGPVVELRSALDCWQSAYDLGGGNMDPYNGIYDIDSGERLFKIAFNGSIWTIEDDCLDERRVVLADNGVLRAADEAGVIPASSRAAAALEAGNGVLRAADEAGVTPAGWRRAALEADNVRLEARYKAAVTFVKWQALHSVGDIVSDNQTGVRIRVAGVRPLMRENNYPLPEFYGPRVTLKGKPLASGERGVAVQYALRQECE